MIGEAFEGESNLQPLDAALRDLGRTIEALRDLPAPSATRTTARRRSGRSRVAAGAGRFGRRGAVQRGGSPLDPRRRDRAARAVHARDRPDLPPARRRSRHALRRRGGPLAAAVGARVPARRPHLHRGRGRRGHRGARLFGAAGAHRLGHRGRRATRSSSGFPSRRPSPCPCARRTTWWACSTRGAAPTAGPSVRATSCSCSSSPTVSGAPSSINPCSTGPPPLIARLAALADVAGEAPLGRDLTDILSRAAEVACRLVGVRAAAVAVGRRGGPGGGRAPADCRAARSPGGRSRAVRD